MHTITNQTKNPSVLLVASVTVGVFALWLASPLLAFWITGNPTVVTIAAFVAGSIPFALAFARFEVFDILGVLTAVVASLTLLSLCGGYIDTVMETASAASAVAYGMIAGALMGPVKMLSSCLRQR